MSRRWWDDQGYQIQLNEKIDTRTWFVVANDEIPGRVVKIIYAGYKIQLPDDSTTIVNPAKDKVLDASNEEYAIAVEAWQARKDAAQRARNAILEEEAKLKQKQKQCLHVSSKHECVTSAAGCDIYETLCLDCGKVLRRSWATAYDRDPDDMVSDWPWWERECKKLYNSVPKLEDYRIVEGL